ncbi:MAG: hypothetical protein M3P24_05285 [Gemmatimonadota bacterium]|nr:hypothetical protein [Gemmatimonadota bacterium]
MREKFWLLDEQMPGGRWTYHTVMAEGEMGFLEWTGERTTAPGWKTAPTRT